jgi:hypothetical protein
MTLRSVGAALAASALILSEALDMRGYIARPRHAVEVVRGDAGVVATAAMQIRSPALLLVVSPAAARARRRALACREAAEPGQPVSRRVGGAS